MRNQSQHQPEDQHITTSTNNTQDQPNPTHETRIIYGSEIIFLTPKRGRVICQILQLAKVILSKVEECNSLSGNDRGNAVLLFDRPKGRQEPQKLLQIE